MTVKYLRGPRKAAMALDRFTKPILAKRGFTQSRITTDWHNIVGSNISKYSNPVKLQFNSNDQTDGILHVEVYNSSIAMEMTYMQPMILEKIAIFYGYKSISRIKIKQKPGKDIEIETPKLQTTHKIQSSTENIIKQIDDPDLRSILQSLGSHLGQED